MPASKNKCANRIQRKDLKTLSISSVWNELLYLAKKEDRSISSYVRLFVKREYEKEIRKEKALLV